MNTTKARIMGGLLSLGLVGFLCHASYRLVDASRNYVVFKSGPEQVLFSNLILYSVYLYVPASYSACINNLRQIDGAKQQYALDHNLEIGGEVKWSELEELFPRDGRPWCPHGGLYSLGKIGEIPRCTVEGHTLD